MKHAEVERHNQADEQQKTYPDERSYGNHAVRALQHRVPEPAIAELPFANKLRRVFLRLIAHDPGWKKTRKVRLEPSILTKLDGVSCLPLGDLAH
ncbi:MAG TPA: hypothetical protein VLA11_03115 [Woeseiaceae bacterium]|jgi:hypothetical protein|nr:hypothetical protein [Woeseiaceae bacterium]